MNRPPSRRAGAAMLVAAVGAMLLIGAGASLLRTAPAATLGAPPTGPPVPAGCDGPVQRDAPVRTTSGALFTCPDRFEGVTVSILGEVVGDVFGRGERRWVQVNDDPYAFTGPLEAHGQTLGTNSGVAVLLPSSSRPGLLGGPSTWGDRIEVVGTYRAAAVADQGGPAVIADHVRVVAPGQPFEDPVDRSLVVAAAVTAAIAGLVWLDVWRASRRR